MIFFSTLSIHAQVVKKKISPVTQKKQAIAVYADAPPRIDGNLSDKVWENVPVASDFMRVRPYNGLPASFRNMVRFLYDDEALYVGAMMYDYSPDSIRRYLSKRDRFSTTDYFGLNIDPFNDAMNAFGFYVTAAGVQVDIKSASGGRYDREDRDWDAVWDSSVKIHRNGWAAEMKIPYSALRFPNEEVQLWAINIFRYVRRTREYTSWNFIDNEQSGFLQQSGTLRGVRDVEPPVRLSFTPYAATYLKKRTNSGAWAYSLKGGMDVKYGLNESYTLDMMLIPDFGQVQSDDEILNLSPFETVYSEKRSFFKEGTELFGLADIFYSRRIGGEPRGYSEVGGKLKDHEKVVYNPREIQLANATKITGKNKKGLGIGFLNAMGLNTYAEVTDTLSGETRKIMTQPFTNYNLMVVDQSLRNNSHFGLINTNFYMPGNGTVANVTGTEFKLANKKNSYAIYAKGAFSRRANVSDPSTGYYHDIDLAKTRGNFRFTLTNRLETKEFNPNDLGLFRSVNEMDYIMRLYYYIYDPFWKFLRLYNSFYIHYGQLYRPRTYTGAYFGYYTSATFRNYLHLNCRFSYRPLAYDYYEPRLDGRYYKRPGYFSSGIYASTDSRKKLSFDGSLGYYNSNEPGRHGVNFGISPRLRISDRMIIYYEFEEDISRKNNGYVSKTSGNDTVYFGKRNQNTMVHTFDADYTFSNKSSIGLRIRHYWSTVDYLDFFTLKQDGSLAEEDNYSANNRNFNAFNIDMVYSWEFAPGSELSIVWKNSIESDEDFLVPGYYDNFKETLKSPHLNSFSIKLLYYLDYLYLKRNV